MLSLGIESTAHTFSCAIVEKTGRHGKILADVRKIYRPPEGEGIHPREASRHHAEHSPEVISECIKKANVKIGDLDMISYAAGPGLGPCLRIGAVVARSLSSYYDIPIYPVNHALGHIELGKMLTGAKDPLVLLVSGGHTMILAFLPKKWRVFGETLDITVGQLLDQIGRHAGFASPCGPKIEDLALQSKEYVPLPYVVKGNDVSFSGLLSATKRIIPKGIESACFSLQETAFSMMGEAVERALAFTEKKEFLVVGGVAANKRLSDILSSICKRHNCKFFVAPKEYAGDCGSQISWIGLLESSTKPGVNLDNTFVKQSWRLDTVEVLY
jgi:N6-L-threonylcarbamoyladenine synthase